MTKSNLFEPLDSIISQAKSYLSESSKRKDIVKEIEILAVELLPELQKRNAELKNISMDMPSDIDDQSMATEIRKGLLRSEFLMENIHLLAEQSWFKEKMADEQQSLTDRGVFKKYVQKECMNIVDGIRHSGSFFDLAEYANRIWAEYELFEEFNRLEEMVTALVRRMNETNLKKTTTHLSKNFKKTLDHIRQNVFRTTKWSAEQIKEYQNERDLEILDKKPLPFKPRETFNLLLLGMGEELLYKIKRIYFIESSFTIQWHDILELTAENTPPLVAKYDAVAVITNFSNNKAILELVANLSKINKPHIIMGTIDPAKIVMGLKNIAS